MTNATTLQPGGAAVTRGHAIGTLVGLLLGLLAATASHAAGTLTPVGAAHQPIRIADHQVRVVITNGFAETEVTQTVQNPNDVALEAVYAFPLPKSASLSELTITAGERKRSTTASRSRTGRCGGS